MVMYEKCSGVQWMGGSQYSLVTVSVPVQYVAGKEPIDGVPCLGFPDDMLDMNRKGARRYGSTREPDPSLSPGIFWLSGIPGSFL